jgi:hypothetical protein
MRQAPEPIGAMPAGPWPPIMMAGWLGEWLKRGIRRAWHAVRTPVVRSQDKRQPSAEQMEALRARFAKDEAQSARNGRAKVRA